MMDRVATIDSRVRTIMEEIGTYRQMIQIMTMPRHIFIRTFLDMLFEKIRRHHHQMQFVNRIATLVMSMIGIMEDMFACRITVP